VVDSYDITGKSVIATDDLYTVLKPYTGRQLNLPKLREAVFAVTRLYRERGYFVARAYLPPQEIDAGIVRVVVVEGRVEENGLALKNSGTRITDARAQQLLRRQIGLGGIIEAQSYERGLLLLNELAGISAEATLVPGGQPGTRSFRIIA
jgi:hemolysin activation/secretion protein